LERRFQPIFVGEPSVTDTIAILRGLKERYEAHHGVRIRMRRCRGRGSLRPLHHRPVPPDKAIDLVDEAASRLRMEIDSSPIELDEADRRVRQLEIELAAMQKESKDVREPVERSSPRRRSATPAWPRAGRRRKRRSTASRTSPANRRAAHGVRTRGARRRLQPRRGDSPRRAAGVERELAERDGAQPENTMVKEEVTRTTSRWWSHAGPESRSTVCSRARRKS
jgi:ATP-dependent Clp protease ATP-binding subunit ClpB